MPVMSLLVVALAAVASCVPATLVRQPVPAPLQLPDKVTVLVGDRIVDVSLEDYAVVSALSEVSPLGESDEVIARVFDLQAVLARTYAARNLGRHRQAGFDLCDRTHCQLYEPDRLRTSRFAAAAREAGRRTAGEVLTYGAHLAETLFHSDCGGSTTAAADVWGQPVPYLLGMVDDAPPSAHRTWQVATPADRLRAALNADPRSAVGRRLTAVLVSARDASGRASTVEVRGERTHSLRGDDFRAIVNRTFGARALQSTLFRVARAGSTFTFSGAGFGHGVGLCQRGAMARLRDGQTVAEVLRRYYAQTAIVRAAPPSAQSSGQEPARPERAQVEGR
jgi:stage II sporulation protein D